MYINDRLWTIDSRAVSHIMEHTTVYRKPELLRTILRRYMREGLIVSEAERHRVQRKVVQRLFSRNGLRAMGEIIQEKANQVGLYYCQCQSRPVFVLHYRP